MGQPAERKAKASKRAPEAASFARAEPIEARLPTRAFARCRARPLTRMRSSGLRSMMYLTSSWKSESECDVHHAWLRA